MEFFKKVSTFPFMHTRKVWYTISGVLVVASLVGLFVRGLDLGVDFTGGMTATATFSGPANTDAVRAGLVRAGFRNLEVQSFGTSHDVRVRLPPLRKGQTSGEVRTTIANVLHQIDPHSELKSLNIIGPQVGSDLEKSAAEALAFTMLLIFIYVALRFHTWRLSFGSILAALHDPIIVVGFFAWSQMTFDLTVVAALLAVIGYSLNDTVVVFDRIRERFEVSRRLAPEQILDQAINQTLSRTVMTSGVTLIVVIVLLLFGGPALRGFSAAMLVGIVAGTYSSIYIASAAALDSGLKAEHLFAMEKKRPVDNMP